MLYFSAMETALARPRKLTAPPRGLTKHKETVRYGGTSIACVVLCLPHPQRSASKLWPRTSASATLYARVASDTGDGEVTAVLAPLAGRTRRRQAVDQPQLEEVVEAEVEAAAAVGRQIFSPTAVAAVAGHALLQLLRHSTSASATQTAHAAISMEAVVAIAPCRNTSRLMPQRPMPPPHPSALMLVV